MRICILSDSKEKRICEYCGRDFVCYKKDNQKFCSVSCGVIWRHKFGDNPGFKKGHKNIPGAEKGWFTTERVGGKNNVNWKNGHKVYRRWALDEFEHKCCLCGLEGKDRLVVHHIDHNRTNNELNNLMILCHSCHKKLHLRTTEAIKNGRKFGI